MQADYLAEAAANHALWRLLNDPGFPADQTVYYMHDLGGGRYGYHKGQDISAPLVEIAVQGCRGDPGRCADQGQNRGGPYRLLGREETAEHDNQGHPDPHGQSGQGAAEIQSDGCIGSAEEQRSGSAYKETTQDKQLLPPHRIDQNSQRQAYHNLPQSVHGQHRANHREAVHFAPQVLREGGNEYVLRKPEQKNCAGEEDQVPFFCHLSSAYHGRAREKNQERGRAHSRYIDVLPRFVGSGSPGTLEIRSGAL